MTTLLRSKYHKEGGGTLRHCVALVTNLDSGARGLIPFATVCQITDDDGSISHQAGRYFQDPVDAARDFAERSSEFQFRYSSWLETYSFQGLEAKCTSS